MRRGLWAWAIAAWLASGAAAQEGWESRIRPEDRARLDRWAGDVHDIVVNLQPGDYHGVSPLAVRQLLDRRPEPLDRHALTGDWRCRSVQFSRNGAFGYPPFRCRIRDTPRGLFFEKLSGSQRLSGPLLEDGEGFVLLGGATVNQEAQRAYRGDGNRDDVVGRLTETGRNRLMLILTGGYGPQLLELTR